MSITNTIQNWVRTSWSPRITSLYYFCQLANRTALTENVKSLTPSSKRAERELIENLALAGIIKYRFHQTAKVSQLEEYMFSGLVTPAMITSFASSLTGSAATADEIANNLLTGVYRSTTPWMPAIARGALSVAFFSGAISAATIGITMFGLTFTSAIVATTGLIVISKIAAKLAWPNPNTWTGKLLYASSKLYYPLVFTASLFGLAAVYQYLHSIANPRYHNERQITISCQDDEQLHARVCRPDGTHCEDSTLWSFTGPQSRERCQASAAGLNLTISNQTLFNSGISADKERLQLYVDSPWRPGFFFDALPWGRTVILDLTPQNLSPSDREDSFAHFTGNFWRSHIMPTELELSALRLRELQARYPYARFRDPRLRANLVLASLNLQQKNYDQVRHHTDQIIHFPFSVTTGRPVFYDEAVLQQAESERLQAIRFFSPDRLDESIRLLLSGLDNPRLGALESGYRSRYGLDLLRNCALGERFFPRIAAWQMRSACEPPQDDHDANPVTGYLSLATGDANHFTPLFTDNFIGVRALLEYGRYLYARHDYAGAAEQYQQVLVVTDLINDCNAATQGDPGTNFRRYSPYMRPLDRWLGEQTSPEIGLWSYARRCEVGRSLRWGDPQLPFVNEQFDPRLFGVFRAQAEQRLAEIELRFASQDPAAAESHLQTAAQRLTRALGIARGIMQLDPFRFFTAMYEEREVYLEILVDYSETLLKIYQLNIRRNPADLARAAGFAQEVISLRGEEPLDILYLRALFIQADIDLINQRPTEAAQAYRQIAERIRTAASQLPAGRSLPPHYEFLQILVQNRLAGLP
jgi:hypothetical protein